MSHTLDKHKYSVHNGGKVQCESCDYCTTDNNNFKRHTNSVHIGIRYAYETCEYAAVHKSQLKHLGIQFKLTEYECQNAKIIPKEHRHSQHFWASYYCRQCEYL